MAGCSSYVTSKVPYEEGYVDAYLGLQNVQQFAIKVEGTPNYFYRIFVDGTALNPLGEHDPFWVGFSANGGNKWLTLTWVVRGDHSIRYEGKQNVYGFEVDSQAAFVAPNTTLGPRVILFGDSFVEPPYGFVGFAQLIGDATGWELLNSGNGGTGYLKTSEGNGNYSSRVTTDVCNLNPKALIVYGSTNDSWQSTTAEQTAAANFFAAVKACAPAARIMAVGAVCPTAENCAAQQALNSGIGAAAAAAGVPFVDPIAESWITPDTAPTYTCMSTIGTNCGLADDIHPTQAGHTNIANHILPHLRLLWPDMFLGVNP
jgi:lysophospholipase L1-like esterase